MQNTNKTTATIHLVYDGHDNGTRLLCEPKVAENFLNQLKYWNTDTSKGVTSCCRHFYSKPLAFSLIVNTCSCIHKKIKILVYSFFISHIYNEQNYYTICYVTFLYTYFNTRCPKINFKLHEKILCLKTTIILKNIIPKMFHKKAIVS